MPLRARTHGTAHPYPRWMQVLAMFCMALVLGATSAQASHLHGTWGPGHAPQLAASATDTPANGSDEAGCPLCTVLHAALAPAPVAAAHPVAPPVLFRPAQVRFASSAPCYFPALSRPPPIEA